METIDEVVRMKWSQKGKLLGFYVALAAVFLYLCNSYIWFTADESFVTYRYAQNLVDHGEIAWNVGQGPVEGFTSFLWMILNAGALFVGVSPLAFSKGISIFSVLVIIALLVWKGRDKPWYLQLGLPAALALSPAVAVLTVQGLGTMVTGLLLLAVSALSVRILKAPEPRWYLAWYAFAYVAALAQPDTLFFSAGVFVVVGAALLAQNRRTFGVFLLWGLPFAALGAGYVAWRVWYFGLLPLESMSFAAASFDPAVRHTAQFVVNVLVPYLLVGIIAFAGADDERSVEVIPTIAGTVLFGAYLVNAESAQGILWSEAIPVLPAVLYVCLHLPSPIESGRWRAQFAAATLGLLLVGWPLHTYADANQETAHRSLDDQIAVGKLLQGIEGRLFTPKSGPLAYYSGWTVLDRLGPDADDRAADSTLQARLQSFEPDLIALRMEGRFSPARSPWREVYPYLKDNPYAVVAATKSTATRKHVYLVRPTSPICKKMVGHLKQARSIPHVSVETVMPDSLDMPVVDVLDWQQGARVCRQQGESFARERWK